MIVNEAIIPMYTFELIFYISSLGLFYCFAVELDYFHLVSLNV